MLSHLLALAAPAAAFLVTPDMAPASKSDHPEGAFKVLPIEDLSPFALPPSVQAQTVHIPCAECHGEDASLRFDISVEQNNRLVINNFEVYPADEPVGDLLSLVSSKDGTTEEELAWVIWWQVVEEDKAQGMHIVDFNLGVGEVGGIPVSDVSFAMSLIIGPNGEILIADVDTRTQSGLEEAEPPFAHKPACKGWFCSVEELWSKLFRVGRGCHKHHGHHGHHGQKAPRPPKFEMPQMDGEETERHAHHLGKMLKNVAAHVFVPVVMGITAGVGAAVLVMFLCSIVAFVARKLAGRETQYSWTLIPPQVVVEEHADSEKSGLVDGQAPPPAYEEWHEKQ